MFIKYRRDYLQVLLKKIGSIQYLMFKSLTYHPFPNYFNIQPQYCVAYISYSTDGLVVHM